MRRWVELLMRILRPIVAAAVGLLLGLIVTWFLGDDPVHVFTVLCQSAFGSAYNLGMTLFYSTPLIFTGLAVALPYRAGLFNIGAEGQLVVGALATTAFALYVPVESGILAPILAGFAGFCGGALWGAVPGLIKVLRGGHEVISTIMLNFIAAAFAGFFILDVMRSSDSASAESQAVGSQFMLPQFAAFDGAPLSGAVWLAVATALLCHFVLAYGYFGFALRAVRENIVAAKVGGVRTRAVQVLAFAIGGGLAGLVGVAEVLGNTGRYRLGFSPEYGFSGIVVALLASGEPLGVIAAALLLGALQKGAADLDLETDFVTRDISVLLQALIILAMASDRVWVFLRRIRPRGN
jgi:simple sugar transport system permease protein